MKERNSIGEHVKPDLQRDQSLVGGPPGGGSAIVSTASADSPAFRRNALQRRSFFANQKLDFINELYLNLGRCLIHIGTVDDRVYIVPTS